jgi:hypothetical protein
LRCKSLLLLSGFTCPASTPLSLDPFLGGQLCLEYPRSSLFFADIVELALELLKRRSVRDGRLSLGVAPFDGP